MSLSPNRKLLIVFLAILAGSALLIGLTYQHGQRVIAVGTILTSESLPRFDGISKLRNAIFAQKPLLYEYYATGDPAIFATRYQVARTDAHQRLDSMRALRFASPELARIESANGALQNLADQLDHTMRTLPVDWDQARHLLAEISQIEGRIAPDVDALVEINRAQVLRYGMQTEHDTAALIGIVLGFSLVGVTVAGGVAYAARTYLRESAARKLLALFTERSPTPMLRLSHDGKAIQFANDAARALALRVGQPNVDLILPRNLPGRVAQLGSNPNHQAQWEYETGGRHIHCTAHLLSDLHACHLYLRDVTERTVAEQQLIEQANHDAVTALPNRRLFKSQLAAILDQSAASCAVALIRPDRIRLVLESQGYAASDNLMRAMATRLEEALASVDSRHIAHLYRFEGATFGLLVSGVAMPEELDPWIHTLNAAIAAPLTVEEREFFFTLSIGAAFAPADGCDTETLFKNAEAAINRVRSEGGSGFRRYSHDLSERTEQWLTMERGLRRALEREELSLHYQPQVDLRSGRIVGFEALLRWSSPESGWVPPLSFIPLAEETGLIIPIGNWVLRTACLQAKRWLAQGNEIVMAVNISARQFQHPDFIALVEQTLGEVGLPADRLELEITESLAMQDAQRSADTLHALRALGVQLSIDDFGTGFSSLAYLQRFPLTKLKVDRSFVSNLGENHQEATIAHTVILLGHSLKLKVIAEGVETKEQLDILRHYGCEEMQGYYFSRPLPAEEIELLLREDRRLAA